MLDGELGHRKVVGIPRRKASAQAHRGGGNEAVCLAKGRSARGKLLSPTSGQLTFTARDRREAEPREQPPDRRFFGRPGAAPDLLDVDCGDARRSIGPAQLTNTVGRRSAAKSIDQDRGVEQEQSHVLKPGSPDTADVALTLSTNPGPWIRVPFVIRVNGSE